jgi:hypothetical protein
MARCHAALSLNAMSVFSRLFGKPHDPTRDWPPAPGASPQMDVEGQALTSFGGRLKLGDRLEAARILGRPGRAGH